MTIALVTNSYPPNLNGVAVAVKNLEEALIDRGIKVVVMTPKVPKAKYPKHVLPLPSTPAPDAISKELRFALSYKSPNVIKFLKENQVDLIHSHDTFMAGMDTVAVAKKLKIPTVHTYHTLVENYDYFSVVGYKQFVRMYSKLVCNHHDAIIALSGKINNYLLDLKVKSTIYNLPNIFIPKNFNSTPEIYNKVYKFIFSNHLDNGNNILTFGRIAKEKNLELSIDLILPLLQEDSTLRYIIMGDGPLRKELENYVEELGMSNQIVFYGSYNYLESSLVAQYSKFFYTVSFSEVLPTTPLEAMSFALPVVCVNDPAYNYIVKNGINGYYVKTSKILPSCKKILYNKKQHLLLSKKALQSYNQYLKIDITQKYIDFYKKIINNYKI